MSNLHFPDNFFKIFGFKRVESSDSSIIPGTFKSGCVKLGTPPLKPEKPKPISKRKGK